MMNAPFENIRIGDTSLRDHYEDVAADALRSIARRKFLILACVATAIVLAALLVSVLPRTYTAQALLYPNMRWTEAQKTSLSASVSGTALVSSEAKRIRSRAIANAVVKRLGLDTNLSEPSNSSTLRTLRSIFLPETVQNTKLARAAALLQSRLEIGTDSRTYVISVNYSSASPELAATIANAVLFEYLRSKEKDRKTRDVRVAKDEFVKLSAIYGKRHPRLAQAKVKLANAERELAIDGPTISDSDWIVLAEPNTTPSSPAGKTILGIASLLGLVTGTCVAFLLERRDNGFKTYDDVAVRASARCFGLVPQIPRQENPANAAQLPSVREALRAVAVAAGIEGSKGSNKVAFVTTIEPPEGVAYFTEALGRVIATAGQRVLFVDVGPTTSPPSGKDDTDKERVGLNDLLADEERARAFFEASKDDGMTVIKGAWESETSEDGFAIRSRALSQFVAAAREHYNLVLITSPLILRPVDTVLIGRESDVKLFAASWNKTPRKAVNSAIKRLRDYDVQINGVVLTDVRDLRRATHYQRLELA